MTTMDKRNELAECVRADPTSKLREVSLQALKQDEKATVNCRHKGLTKRLLRHELAEITTVLVLTEYSYRGVSVEEAAERDDPDVIGVDAKVPIGTLKIQGSARNNNYLSNLVST